MNFNFQETFSYNPWDIDLQDKLDNLIYKRIDSILNESSLYFKDSYEDMDYNEGYYEEDIEGLVSEEIHDWTSVAC